MIVFKICMHVALKLPFLNCIVSSASQHLTSRKFQQWKSFEEPKVEPSRSHHFRSPSFRGISFQSSQILGHAISGSLVEAKFLHILNILGQIKAKTFPSSSPSRLCHIKKSLKSKLVSGIMLAQTF